MIKLKCASGDSEYGRQVGGIGVDAGDERESDECGKKAVLERCHSSSVIAGCNKYLPYRGFHNAVPPVMGPIRLLLTKRLSLAGLRKLRGRPHIVSARHIQGSSRTVTIT
jgi:hypothetical protein